MAIQYNQAKESDIDNLAEIRAQAMKPSLEKIGRYDPQRVRQRLIDDYDASVTTTIVADSELVGFYVVKQREQALYLQHLYLLDRAQGLGIGRKVIERVKESAVQRGLTIELQALQQSPANDFYLSLGFVQYAEDELDVYYRWSP